MTKPKTLEQLRTEKERAETQLAQEQHKLERLENRKKYLEKGERQKRTHRLCNLGGTVESLAPEVKDLTRTEMTELMEHIFSLSEVQRAVRHMAITHISHIQGQRRNDPGKHGQRDFPGRAGKLHHQGNFRELAGKGHDLHADRGPLPWAVGKLQPEHPAAGPGADDTQRTGYHAGRQVHFAAAGPAPVLLAQIRFEAAPELQIYIGG